MSTNGKDISTIELCSVPASYGKGANDGAYYPVGLLTLGTHLRRTLTDLKVTVVDLHHDNHFNPTADLVGISASSTLNYQNVLALAKKAKDAGSIVVLGGPHASQLAEQVLRNRQGLIDYIITGNAEKACVTLTQALRLGDDLSAVPALCWRKTGGEVICNAPPLLPWRYDDFLPLDISLLPSGLEPYWSAFRNRIDPSVDAAFVVFTHFGCGYREMMRRHNGTGHRLTRWCSYCSLNDSLSMRAGQAIVEETLQLLTSCRVAPKSNVLLKCYGDNVGTQKEMLSDLASAIESSDEWKNYQIGWTFYAQSSRVSDELIRLLLRVGTKNIYIGFDAIDDDVQRLNGLGTSTKAHHQAVRLCEDNGIKVQAGFVLGCAGETQQSLAKVLKFAEDLASRGVLERINSAIFTIIPGSPAYSLLCEREPWVKYLDSLPTEELQWLWIKHFCPELGRNPTEGMKLLRQIANRVDDLSPGPHASMGFESGRLISDLVAVGDPPL